MWQFFRVLMNRDITSCYGIFLASFLKVTVKISLCCICISLVFHCRQHLTVSACDVFSIYSLLSMACSVGVSMYNMLKLQLPFGGILHCVSKNLGHAHCAA